MITNRLILESAWRRGYQSSFQRTMKRTFTVAVGPGSNPLKVLQVTSANRLSCEPESGFSNPGKHWTFNISINRGDSSLVRILMHIYVHIVLKLLINRSKRKLTYHHVVYLYLQSSLNSHHL